MTGTRKPIPWEKWSRDMDRIEQSRMITIYPCKCGKYIIWYGYVMSTHDTLDDCIDELQFEPKCRNGEAYRIAEESETWNWCPHVGV